MIAASRTNVHQQRSLFRLSFRCVEPRWRGGRVQYVCVESPEVSSPGGCSVAPPSGPERQRRPLLETKTDGFVTSERPRQLTQMSMTAKWKEFQWQLEQHWDQNVVFFCRISWSGVTLVPWQILLFSSANQDTPNQKKPLKARTDAKGGANSRQPPSCPFFVSVNSSTTRTAAHSKPFFPLALILRLNLIVSAAMCRSTHPANHRADSFSVWQEVVVEVALPSLLSFRKLGFSIATVTATSLLLGFPRVVKARFSEALAESPSLWIKI